MKASQSRRVVVHGFSQVDSVLLSSALLLAVRARACDQRLVQDNPMNPHGLLIAYAENTVKPADASGGRRIPYEACPHQSILVNRD